MLQDLMLFLSEDCIYSIQNGIPLNKVNLGH